MLCIRNLILVSLCVCLAGCPAQRRIYVHNESAFSLSSAYQNPKLDVVEIRPGRTRYIVAPFSEEACFGIAVGELTRAFEIPMDIMAKSPGYGARLDVYFEYGQFHFQRSDGRWAQLDEIARCDRP